MENTTNVIDLRGSQYQTCWGCGHLAGGCDRHLYYGNFAFGIQHGDCGTRIKGILDRSLRALSILDKEADHQTQEIIMRALITTSARKLGNCNLNTIKEDDKIRSVIEKEGMAAALQVFRSISNLDDNEWENQLKNHNEIMHGPELIQKELSTKDKFLLSKMKELLKAGEQGDEKNFSDVMQMILKA